MLVQQMGDRALLQIRIRRERAFEIIEIGEQRLLALDIAGRDQTHHTPWRTGVEQLRRAGGIFASHCEPCRFVAHLDGERDGRVCPVLAVFEAEARRSQNFAARALRLNTAFAHALGPGTQHGERKTVRDIFRRQQRQRSRLLDEDIHIADTGKCCVGRARFPVLDAIAQPKDFGLVRKSGLGECGDGACAIARPRFRHQRICPALGFACVEKTRVWRIGGRHEHDGAAIAGGRLQGIGDGGLALVPAMRSRPAIVDEQHNGTGASDARRAPEHRLGECEDHKRRHEQAQQQKPERRMRGRFFRVLQTQKQAQRRKDDAPGKRRRHPQQEPDRRQKRERREDPRCAEAQLSQQAHGEPYTRACFAPLISA